MSAAAGPLVNGLGPPPFHSVNEALEYEKILKLRDEVFAGSHPRLRMPAHALKITSPRQQQVHSHVSALFAASPPANQTSTEQPRREQEPPPTLFSAGRPSLSNIQPAPNVVSEFDPILLTKSDDLVRAETQLKRQRLEKALRDQFENKRMEARKRPAPAEAKPDFDISAVLAKALEVAKPSSFKDDESASDSFDENSFYSSRAPDSTPERGAPSPSPSQHHIPVRADEFDADGPSGHRVQSAVMGSPLHAAHNYDESPRTFPSASRSRVVGNVPDMTSMDIDDEEEEGEYSPPEAVEEYPTPNDAGSQMLQDSRDPRGRPLRRYSELGDDGKRPASPSEAKMRIVRNHITSPVAPQPSRVSPLAIAKDGSVLQNGRMRRDRGRQQATSPEPGQQYPPRKKRKVDKRGERKGRRNGGLSPDAFIKEENVSPPPFHDVQPLGSGRLRPTAADRPIIIDDGPVQNMRYVPVDSDRFIDSPARPLSRHVEPVMPLSEPRVLSRAMVRPLRDDQDLRRVVSMHNMRPEQPREYLDPVYDSPTRARAPSYRAASPMAMPPRPQAEAYERAPLQEVRVSRTPVPTYQEIYRDQEPELRYQAIPAMPPPALERIVVDQYGRRFREIIQPERASVAPRAVSVRPSEPEVSHYEAYRGGRSGSVFVDAAPERRYVQEMPPPPAIYRQNGDTPRAVPAEFATGREAYENPAIQQSSNAQVVDRSSRQPIYMDERGDFGEPVRMASARPTTIRHDEAQSRESIVRGQSVRPVGREGSILVDERGQVRREYVPVEQPRYRVVEPEQRYFDAQGREVIAVDGSRDGRQRFVQRY